MITQTFRHEPGALVRLRQRDWVVLPSNDPELLLVKPMGGSEEETTGIYLPLALPEDRPEPSQFPHPTAEDLGHFDRPAALQRLPALIGILTARPSKGETSIGKITAIEVRPTEPTPFDGAKP